MQMMKQGHKDVRRIKWRKHIVAVPMSDLASEELQVDCQCNIERQRVRDTFFRTSSRPERVGQNMELPNCQNLTTLHRGMLRAQQRM